MRQTLSRAQNGERVCTRGRSLAPSGSLRLVCPSTKCCCDLQAVQHSSHPQVYGNDVGNLAGASACPCEAAFTARLHNGTTLAPACPPSCACCVCRQRRLLAAGTRRGPDGLSYSVCCSPLGLEVTAAVAASAAIFTPVSTATLVA